MYVYVVYMPGIYKAHIDGTIQWVRIVALHLTQITFNHRHALNTIQSDNRSEINEKNIRHRLTVAQSISGSPQKQHFLCSLSLSLSLARFFDDARAHRRRRVASILEHIYVTCLYIIEP